MIIDSRNSSATRLAAAGTAASGRTEPSCRRPPNGYRIAHPAANWRNAIVLLAVGVLPAAAWAAVSAPDPLARPAPAWRAPVVGEVKARAFDWLDAQKPDAAVRAKAKALWSDLPAAPTEDDLLARLAKTFALADPRAAKLAAQCSQPRSPWVLPAQSWLADKGTSPFLAANLRLFYAQWLVQQSLFDEALEQLSGLTPDDVAAPAALLFYQSVVYHALLQKESGLKSIDDLLQGAQSGPQRYVALARLMQDDLKGLEADTLDHIARRMGDIRRRLDLGRAGPKVRQIEDGVVKSLDRLIKKLEEQQEQCGGGGNAQGIRSSRPAQNSTPAGGQGPGEVAKKAIGSSSGWGDLPARQREEAMQQLGRDFPSHYRDVIEQYFRRLAAEKSERESP
jgi:hypothetical protein